jgi:hypothetical protein
MHHRLLAAWVIVCGMISASSPYSFAQPSAQNLKPKSIPSPLSPEQIKARNESIRDESLSFEENVKKAKRNEKKMMDGVKVLEQANDLNQPPLRSL